MPMTLRFAASLVLATMAASALAQDFQRQADLLPIDTPNNLRDQQGISVDIDGDTAAIGATLDLSGSPFPGGGVSIYRRRGDQWELEALLRGGGGAPTRFGWSVALSGDLLLVGQVAEAQVTPAGVLVQGAGTVHAYRRSGGTWSAPQEVQASDRASGDAFGYSIAIDGTRAVIGAPGVDRAGLPNAGAAYVFEFQSSRWVQRAKLQAGDAGEGDVLGIDVAITADSVFAGAIGAGEGPSAGQGAVYVFGNAPAWQQTQKLVAPDGEGGDGFGIAVDADGNRAVIGAFTDDIGDTANQGSAHVFERAGNAWVSTQKLVASDGGAGDVLGWSVAVSGDAVLLGGQNAGADQSSTRYFRLRGGEWNQEAAPTPSDVGARSELANAVALDGGFAIAGFPSLDLGASRDRGRAYLHELRDGAWLERVATNTPTSSNGTFFGYDIDIDDGHAVIGGPGYPSGSLQPPQWRAGAVYFAARGSDGTWRHVQSVAPRVSEGGDGVGYRVAISGATAMVSAFNPASNPDTTNGVYVIERIDGVWTERSLLRDRDGRIVAATLVDVHGDRAVVGNHSEAWFFRRVAGEWVEEARFALRGASLDNDTLRAVAIHGDRALLGFPKKDVGATHRGAVYVMVRHDGQWALETRLLAPETEAFQNFGTDVALENDTALIGAPGGEGSTFPLAGRAYAFARGAAGWQFEARFDSAAPHEAFGMGVDLGSGGTVAVVGARVLPGDCSGGGLCPRVDNVQVHERSAAGWVRTQTLATHSGDRLATDGRTVMSGLYSPGFVEVFNR